MKTKSKRYMTPTVSTEVKVSLYELLADSVDRGTIQIVQGLPYRTCYFLGEPQINPKPFMAGQRVYRPWVLEDTFSITRGHHAAILADDHAFCRWVWQPTMREHHRMDV